MMKEQSRQNTKPVSIGVRLWRFFSSIRLALILILVLTALSVVGVFFYLFNSAWFLVAGGLLIINIIVCSLNRWKQTRSGISLSPARLTEGYYKTDNLQPSLSVTSAPDEAGREIVGVLQKRHFKVSSETGTGSVYLAADKNRYSPLGTYIIHLSLILFIIGYLVGNFLGFKDANFIIPEGITRDIGNDTGLSVRLNSFTDEYYPDGRPKDYRSDVTVFKNNQEVKSGTIRVNEPLSYEGIRIYQSFFGPAVRIQVRRIDDTTVLYDRNIPLDRTLENRPYQRPAGGFGLSGEGYMLFFVGRAVNMADSVLTSEQIGMEVYRSGSNMPVNSVKMDKNVPSKVGSLEVTYLGDAKFSGFQVSSDPGNSLIWIASGLFVLGLVIVFYFPRRRIWALVQPGPEKGSQLWLRTDSTRKLGAAAEVQSIIQEIEKSKMR